MHKFDTFTKPLQEFQVKTRVGGVLSIFTVVTILWMLVAEVKFYLEVERRDEMVVDLGQDKKLFTLKTDLWVGFETA